MFFLILEALTSADFIAACASGSLDLVQLLVEKGASNYERALEKTTSHAVTVYLEDKIAELVAAKEAEEQRRLDELDAIEATNPFLFSERSAARSRLGDFAGAADDALEASVEFKDVGDKLRSLLASSDAALALYGSGEVDEAVQRMKQTFTSYGNKSPASNK